MRTKQYIRFTTLSVLAAGAMVAGILTSCSKDDTAALIDGQNNNYPADGMVRISTTLGDAQVMSRAEGEGTPATYTGTNLSLSVDYGEGDKYTRPNILWNNTSGAWVQDLTVDADPMLWKSSTTAAKIYAFAPHVGDATTDLTAVPFSVQADQSAEGAILASDLVGYQTDNFVPGSSLDKLNALNIAFTHRLSKLTVNLTYGNQYPEGELPAIKNLEVINTNLSATYNAQTLAVTASTAAGNIKAATVKTNSYEAILVPQTVAASTKLVLVTLADGTKLSYTTPADQLFEANKQYTLSLRIGKDKLEVGSVTVDDWTTGTPITGGEVEPCVRVDPATHTITANKPGCITAADITEALAGGTVLTVAGEINSSDMTLLVTNATTLTGIDLRSVTYAATRTLGTVPAADWSACTNLTKIVINKEDVETYKAAWNTASNKLFYVGKELTYKIDAMTGNYASGIPCMVIDITDINKYKLISRNPYCGGTDPDEIWVGNKAGKSYALRYNSMIAVIEPWGGKVATLADMQALQPLRPASFTTLTAEESDNGVPTTIGNNSFDVNSEGPEYVTYYECSGGTFTMGDYKYKLDTANNFHCAFITFEVTNN